MRISDWSSDVCSSDLLVIGKAQVDPLDLFFFDHFQNVIRRIRHLAYPSMFQMCCRRMHALPAFGVIPCARGTQIASESLRSEEYTSELQSLMRISYAVFCLKKKKNNINHQCAH